MGLIVFTAVIDRYFISFLNKLYSWFAPSIPKLSFIFTPGIPCVGTRHVSEKLVNFLLTLGDFDSEFLQLAIKRRSFSA